jgi:hypothetical protein
MRNCERFTLTLASVAALLMLAGAALAADKPTEAKERAWSPIGSIGVMADVAEVEPNGSLATAQAINAGDVLRPASIGAAADTDYVVFTATAGQLITLGTDADGTTTPLGDSRIRLFDASGVQLAMDDDGGPGLYSLITFTATYTGTYYGGLAAYSATGTGIYKAFLTLTTPLPPPTNDVCATALPITCGNVNITGSTLLANNDYTLTATSCTGYSAAGRDIVYSLAAIGGEVVDLTYTSAGDGVIYLITDCASPATSCVAGADATVSGGVEHLVYTITAPGTYYLIVDNYGTNVGGNFTMTGSYVCPPTSTHRSSWGGLKSIYR